MFPDLAKLLAAPAWLLDLLDTSVRVTVLLGAAGLTAYALRRAPAQARHQVWALALGATLLLPVAAVVLPAWRPRVLPAPAAATERPASPVMVVAVPAPPMGHAQHSGVTVHMVTWPSPADSTVVASLPLASPDVAVETGVPTVHVKLAKDALTPTSVRVDNALPISLGTWLLGLWLVGMALVAARVAFDWAKVWALRHQARAVTGERLGLFESLQTRMGLQRVKLVELNNLDLPITWGLFEPTVALPVTSKQWSTTRLEAALLHELAHVRRKDALTQLMAWVACSLYWFHPLTWLAAKQMRVLREYACDDEVVGQGVRPSSYAEELIGIVQGLRDETADSSATLAMARRSPLGARLMALLDPRVPHTPLRRANAALLKVGAAGLLVSLAIVRPAVAETQLPRLSTTESSKRQVTQAPSVAATPPVSTPAPTPPAALQGPSQNGRRPPVATPAPVASPAPVAAPAPLPAPAPMATPAPMPTPPEALPPMAPLAAPADATEGADEAPCDQDEDSGGFSWSFSPGTSFSMPSPDVRWRPSTRRNDDELQQLERLRQEANGDERVLARGLLKFAHDADLETETSRQAYLAAASTVRDESTRVDVLKAFLKGAPISVESGRGVLVHARQLRSDNERAELISMMHRIRESDLVRGPLAAAYLDAVEQFASQQEFADGLRELLHPQEVVPEAVERALALLQRVTDPDLRHRVLIEVTDHQVITPAVEAAYQALTANFTGSLAEDSRERLADAKAEARNAGRHFAWNWKNGWSSRGNGPDQRAFDGARDAQARQQQQAMQAELDRALAREKENLRRQQAQLAERAKQLKDQAREFAKQYKARAKALKEQMKQKFGKDVDVDADVDLDVSADGESP